MPLVECTWTTLGTSLFLIKWNVVLLEMEEKKRLNCSKVGGRMFKSSVTSAAPASLQATAVFL